MKTYKLGQRLSINGKDVIITGIFDGNYTYRQVCYFRNNKGEYIGSTKYHLNNNDTVTEI